LPFWIHSPILISKVHFHLIPDPGFLHHGSDSCSEIQTRDSIRTLDTILDLISNFYPRPGSSYSIHFVTYIQSPVYFLNLDYLIRYPGSNHLPFWIHSPILISKVHFHLILDLRAISSILSRFMIHFPILSLIQDSCIMDQTHVPRSRPICHFKASDLYLNSNFLLISNLGSKLIF
jgi:hypothetical protein